MGAADPNVQRNRIITIAALVVVGILFVWFLVGFISCVSSTLGGAGQQQAQSGSAAAASASASASSTAASQQSYPIAAPQVPEGEGVEDPWVEGGRFTTGDAELDRMVKQFCDENSDPNLSAAENAEKVYHAAVWREYVEDDNNQEPVGPNWAIDYAKQSFQKGTGNCYEFAAVDAFILRYFGYHDARAEPCLVLLQSGGYGDHGLTFVTDFDGRKCLCDSSLGANGWMLEADSYTVQIVDVGQDSSEYADIAYEKVVKAKWVS